MILDKVAADRSYYLVKGSRINVRIHCVRSKRLSK